MAKSMKPRDKNQMGDDTGGGPGSSRDATDLYKGLSNSNPKWPDKGITSKEQRSVNDDAVRGPGDVPKSPGFKGRTA
jgi:hypothetical protein